MVKRPPLFTNGWCRLVSDQFSIRFGSSSRGHEFPKIAGDQAEKEPHLVGPEQVTTKTRHLRRLHLHILPV